MCDKNTGHRTKLNEAEDPVDLYNTFVITHHIARFENKNEKWVKLIIPFTKIV